jgi:hypothetical protein
METERGTTQVWAWACRVDWLAAMPNVFFFGLRAPPAARLLPAQGPQVKRDVQRQAKRSPSQPMQEVLVLAPWGGCGRVVSPVVVLPLELGDVCASQASTTFRDGPADCPSETAMWGCCARYGRAGESRLPLSCLKVLDLGQSPRLIGHGASSSLGCLSLNSLGGSARSRVPSYF